MSSCAKPQYPYLGIRIECWRLERAPVTETRHSNSVRWRDARPSGRLRPPKTPSFPPTTWLGGLIRARKSPRSGQRKPGIGEALWADQRRPHTERAAEQEV